MTKEPHITEFTAKKGNGLHIRVTTTRNGRRIAVDGGRLYYKDYSTKADCLRKARRIRDEILSDLDFTATPTMPTVNSLYEKSFELMPLSLNSRIYYDSLYKAIEMQDKPINTITLEQLQMAISTYALTHTQNRTVRFIELWKRIYKTAFMLQLPIIDYSAMIAVPKSRVLPNKRKTDTSYEEFIRFIDYAQQYEFPIADAIICIAWTMYYTGMRTQEILGLYESDIDFSRNIIHVSRSVGSTVTKKAQIVPLKTAKSERDIPLAPALVPVLQKAVSNCKNKLLFPDSDGNPLAIEDVCYHVRRINKTANTKLALYQLRHLFAADLFRQGTNPKVIQSLMGHKTENMSLYYAFTTEEEKTDAIIQRKPS